MIDQLTFDTTDADTIADSSHVGAHTLSGAGDLITSGDGSADDLANTFEGLDTRSFLFGYDSVGDNWDRLQQTAGALNVFIDGGDFDLAVDLDGIYDGVNNTDPDNVGIIAHARSATPGDTDQTFRSTGAGLGNVLAADAGTVQALDVNAFVMGYDGTDYRNITVDSSGNTVVSATDLDIRSLDHTSAGANDSVRLGDGTDFLTSTTVGSSIGLDVNSINDPSLAETSLVAASTDLATASTSQDVVASPLTARKYLWVYNNDNRRMFIGGTGVTEATGFPVAPNNYVELRAGAAVDVEFVSPKINHNIRTLELA